jgi:hypothetical protein
MADEIVIKADLIQDERGHALVHGGLMTLKMTLEHLINQVREEENNDMDLDIQRAA